MNAKALICDEKQSFALEDVVLPDLTPDTLVVRTLFTGVSIGTEFALIRNKISWGPYPLCTGYQGVGVVDRVGSGVVGFKAGDKVYYRDNRELQLVDGRAVSAVSGTHCSMAVINAKTTHGLALLPDGVDPEPASMFVMPAVGLLGTDMANPRMGQTVVVYGAGLIGLGVVAACSHRGCRVVAIDIEPRRLEVARQLGADVLVNASAQDAQQVVKQVAPDGADVVFEATGLPECIDKAIPLCKWRGTFVWQGNYGAAPISIHFIPPHARQLTMVFPCDDGQAPCRRAVLKNMAMGVLRWEKTITHRVPAPEAAAFYTRINKGEAKDVIGAVIRWA